MKPSIFYSSRQPYLKYLAIILTTITIYVLTHSSYLADPNINDVTTKPILETVPQPPPQSPSSPEQQQQQQPANQDQIVKVPEELKNKPQDLVVDNNKDQKPAVSGVPKSSSSSPQQQEKQDTKKELENSSSSKDPVKSEKVKATFVTLARNSELYDLIKSIRNVEDRFNRKFNYDWVFLNDDDFTQEFKDLTTALVSGKTKYGKIPKEHWSYPDWIDLKRAEETRKNMKLQKIIYGDSESYRHMCRFESGFFWRHPLLDDYDWYWRVEPSIDIHCDLNYDLFKYMEDNNKVYGFTISIHEFRATIPTLWDTTKKFIKENPQYLAENNFMDFISDDKGETYNLCHFWSNFEIANLNFWRGEAYRKYFDYLDQTGGFFYERWGDAPIHSIAAALFLPKDKIHYFDDVGYKHSVYTQCPLNPQFRYEHKCHCNPDNDFTFRGYSCGKKYFEKMGLQKPKEWEKYQ